MSFGIRSVAALLLMLVAAGTVAAQNPGVVAVPSAKTFQQLEAQKAVQTGPVIKKPPPPQVRRVQVPVLSSEGAIANFESRVRETCRITFQVGRPKQKSSSPVGSIVGQDPPANTIISCGQPVNVFVAVLPYDVPAQPPQPTSPTEPTKQSGAGKSKVPWLMTDMTRNGAEAALRAEGARRCETFFVDDLRRSDPQQAGSVIDQNPRPGIALSCGMRPSVTYSLGPPQAPRFTVTDLSQPTGRLNFESLVRSGCASDFRLLSVTQHSAVPAGEFLRQFPPAGTVVGCGAKVGVYYSSGPTQIPGTTGGKTGPATNTIGKQPAGPMPDMSQPGADDRLDQQLQTHCGPNYQPQVSRSESPSDKPAGTLISQSPPDGTALRCDAGITIVRAFQSGPEGGGGWPWGRIALAIVAAGMLAAGAFLWHALLHPHVVVGAVGLVAAPGDAWTGGPLARIALVSGGIAQATPPVPLPVAAVEIADV